MLLLPTTALAAPIDDFEWGWGIDLSSIEVEVDGEVITYGGDVLPKPGGTLDVTTSLSAFGLQNTQPIYAQGVTNGNVVEWSFNTTFNPPVNLDGSIELDHANGFVRVEVTPIQGVQGFLCTLFKCPRSVEYSLAPGSWVNISGTGPLNVGWSEAVTLNEIHGYAGAPVPDVSYFGMDDHVMGEQSTPKPIAMHFNLDRTAPKGGATIELVSSAPAGLSVPATVTIPEGQWFGTASAWLAPGFDGIVRVQANTPFGASAEFVRLVPYKEPGNYFKLPTLVLPEWLAGCLYCLNVFHFDEAWSGLGTLDDRAIYFTQHEIIDLADQIGVESATAIAASSSGWVTGTVQDSETALAYAMHMQAPQGETLWLGEHFTPAGITDHGWAVGTMVDQEGEYAALHDGTEAFPLAVDGAWTRATAASRHGNVTGIAAFGRTQMAFSLVGEDVMYYEVPGAVLVPTAINGLGDAVANASLGGTETAYVLTQAGDTIPIQLEGYDQTHATAINDLGWVVGTATSAELSTGFLWLPSGVVMDLSLASPDDTLVVPEALDINDDGDILARTLSGGEKQFHVLRF